MAAKTARLWQNEFDCLAPVPLHPRRLRERGFNQAKVLASCLDQGKLRADLLIRLKNNRPQVGLSGRERMANVRGVFALNLRYKAEGLRVLLVDDVWTTGATLRECARALKKAGAARVGAITLTRSGESGRPL
jgi:ComF family protein